MQMRPHMMITVKNNVNNNSNIKNREFQKNIMHIQEIRKRWEESMYQLEE